MKHFKDFFKEECRTTIAKVVKMATLFHSFVIEEDNSLLTEKVTKKELREVLHSF